MKIRYSVSPLLIITISLLAIFGCSDDNDELLPDGETPGKVYDIDGNEYKTVLIGDQIWMAENLRVSRYNNGEDIPTGLSNEEWENSTVGAYAIYPHEGGYFEDFIEGIGSDHDMVNAYGKLYNWYVVVDPRGVCPEGWHVPTNDDWSQFLNFIIDEYDAGYHYEDPDGVGNFLKSCLQVNSPYGEGCNTISHPRWNAHNVHHGFDEFGFSALPGGYRFINGQYYDIGNYVYWWSSTENSSTESWWWSIRKYFGSLNRYFYKKQNGLSIRCVRKIDE